MLGLLTSRRCWRRTLLGAVQVLSMMMWDHWTGRNRTLDDLEKAAIGDVR